MNWDPYERRPAPSAIALLKKIDRLEAERVTLLGEFVDWFAKETSDYERDDAPCPDRGWVDKFLKEKSTA